MAFRIRVSVNVPKEIINVRAVQQAIAKAQRDKTRPQITGLFRQTVDGWSNKPDWSSKQTITTSYISMKVWASGENADQYQIVNNGSPEHPIFPRNLGGFLVFQKGYRSSTRPRVLSSRPFSRFGVTVGARSIPLHPGFDPRAFDETVADAIIDDFRDDMQQAINDSQHVNWRP